MSTLDSNLFIAATTVGHDFSPAPEDPDIERRRTRIGLGLSAVIAAFGAMAFDSVVEVWHDVGSVVTSALLLPVLAIHLPTDWRPRQNAAVAAMLLGAATAACWIFASEGGTYPFGLEPMFPALILAALCLVTDRVLRSRPGS
jgi:Na+/pantothenate symporter